MKVLKNLWKFITDWHYRHEMIEEHWNWKSKILVAITLFLIVFGLALKVNYFNERWVGYKQCFGEEWDTGRDTKFGFIFNSCVIDSGKRDADGEVVWQKVKRDIAVGDFQ